MSQPEWPLPLGPERGGEVFRVHKNLLVALINAVGGVVVFNEYDLIRDLKWVTVVQVMNDNGTMTLKVEGDN